MLNPFRVATCARVILDGDCEAGAEFTAEEISEAKLLLARMAAEASAQTMNEPHVEH